MPDLLGSYNIHISSGNCLILCVGDLIPKAGSPGDNWSLSGVIAGEIKQWQVNFSAGCRRSQTQEGAGGGLSTEACAVGAQMATLQGRGLAWERIGLDKG